jgi:N-acetylneuraminic acid mutarotase
MRSFILIIYSILYIGNVGFSQCYWAKQISCTPNIGTPVPETNSLTTDSQGNIYSTGTLHVGNYDLNTGAGTQVVSTNSRFGFIEKLDQDGNFIFGKTIEGNGSVWGNSITLDNSGNIIVAGTFTGTADFDPGPTTFNITASNYDGFICSLDTDGNLNWAIKIGGTNPDYITSIDVDANNSIVASGFFQGTTDLDPSPSNFNLTSNGSDDIFIVKLTSTGNFIWAKSVGGIGQDRCNSLKCDFNSNVILSGYFNNTVDFDPNTGVSNLTSAGGNDIFLMSISTSGVLNFALRIGNNLSDIGKALSIDNQNNLFLTGDFAGIVDFDPGAGIFNLSSTSNNTNAFVLKLTSNGIFNWVKQITGLSSGKGITIDSQGNIASTGQFSNSGTITADLDPGPGSLTYTNMYQNVYVQKLDNLGNFISGLKIGDNTGGEVGTAITADNNDNIITSGIFSNITDFDPGLGTFPLTTNLAGNNYIGEIFYFKVYEQFTLPQITVNGSLNFCQGDSVTLGSSYINNNIWSTNESTQNIIVFSSGTFYTTYSDGICFSSSQPVTVTVSQNPPTPTITTNGSLSYCQGNIISTNLTSSVGSAFLWSTGEVTQTITVTSAGSYTVEVENASGCSSVSNPVNIVVNSIPTANATNNGPNCIGNPIVLNASGGSSYSWSGPGGFTSTAQNPVITNATTAMSGTYTVTVTSNGCSSTASTIVTVNPNPSATITAGGTAAFCQGGSVTLSANTGTGLTYQWKNNGVNIPGATQSTYTANSSGSYSVTVSNTGGCTANSNSVSVTVFPNSAVPTISANGPTTFCEGGSVVLTSNFAENTLHDNTWYNGSTIVGSNQSVTITTSGTYYVAHEYTPSNQYYCPSNSVSITITVLPAPSQPSITAIGPLTFCQGGSVTLNSSSATDNIWSNGATQSSITVVNSGTYTLQVTDGVCNSINSDPITVTTVSPPQTPIITANGSINLCKGEMVTLASNLSSGILWSNGEITPYIDVYDAGNYTVSVSNGVCPTLTSNPVLIVVNDPSINISASGQLAENSPNTSITFTATISNAGVNPSYQWYKNGLPVGSNSLTYTNNNWVNGEKIICRVTSSSGCSVYSNDLFVWLAQVNQDSWQRVADAGLDRNMIPPIFPTRVGAVSFTIGNKIYVGLGYNDNHALPTMPNTGYLSDFWEYNTITDEWTERAPFAYGNSPRMNAIAFVVNGKGYVGFGMDNNGNGYFNDLWEYDPQTDTWVQKSNCPGIARHSAVATNIGTSGYVGTGWGLNTYTNDWWKYTPSTDTWTQLTNFPHSNFGLTCAAVNNKIYVMGSSSITQTIGNGINYEYNPDNNTWTQKASMPGDRYYAESFVINDTIFICGGQLNPSGDPCQSAVSTLNEVWTYYPINDSWDQKSNIKFGKISNGCAASVNGNGYYIGGGYYQSCPDFGYWNYGGYGREANLKYSTQTDTWEVKAVHGGIKKYFGFSTTIGDKGYALFQYFGLNTNPVTNLDVFEVYMYEYDRLNNTWKQKAKYPGQGIFQAGNGFSINGKIYYGSGASSNNVFVSDFWEYNPINDTWTLIGSVPIASNRGYNFVLNSKGYVGGGQMGNSFFEFNPTSYSWAPKASIPASPSGNINFSLNNIGYTSTYTTATTGSLYKYDPSINIWTLVNNLPNYTAGISNSYFSFQTSSKGFYGTGINSTTTPQTTSLIYEFNPLNNLWTQRQNLPENHSQGGTFSFSSDSYILCGTQYYAPHTIPVNSVWQYKPICQNSASTLNASACSSYVLNGQTYTQSGNYTQILTNSLGCDSTITLNLSITNPPSDQVTLSGNSLTAVASGGSYQWLDCNSNFAPISGANSQTYQPISSGSYAVSITIGACTIVSSCNNITTSGVSTLDNQLFNLYPNPTSSIINIEKPDNIEIFEISLYDVSGRKLSAVIPENKSVIQIVLPVIPGTYHLKIEDKNGKVETFKVIKI